MSSTIDGAKRHALGVSMKRKEDPRLIRGRGRYLDDISLPNMLHLAIVHSPYPHARIKNIDATAAMAVPGVKAVLTAKDLEGAGLAWIPTFHGYDKQMILAVGKVLYQYQEVAGVIAETREAAHDAAELVEVDYEPLEPVVDPFVAKQDKTILRDDRENKTNHIYHWEVGDRAATDAALASSERPHRGAPLLPALSPGAARTVRDRRRHESGDGAADALPHVAGATRAPDGRLARHGDS